MVPIDNDKFELIKNKLYAQCLMGPYIYAQY